MLFASEDATLLPEAQARLDKVAEVLLATSDRNVTVEGHTDSSGPREYNLDLSRRRANSVRDYLVQREYGADKIQAYGLGAGYPMGDNSTSVGRSSNRRVEIVIEADPLETRPIGENTAEGE